MRNIHEPLDRLARVRDGELTDQASAAGARALLASIVAGPGATTTAVTAPAPWRLRMPRLAAGALAAGVLVTGVIVGPGVLGSGSATSYANSAIDIERDGDQYVARIKDPFADHAKYTEAFHAVGLDIELRLVPASPTGVGRFLSFMWGRSSGAGPARSTSGGSLPTLAFTPQSCRPDQDDCGMTVRVPADYTGSMRLSLGRRAEPGEEYENREWATAPGEMFDGVRLQDGRPVDAMLAEARRRDLTVEFSRIRPDAETGALSFEPLPADQVRGDWTVWEAWQVKAGVIRLLVTPERLPENPFEKGAHLPS
ncbi:hypothetical protein [Streptosporangium sp. NBC_01756]|uniref:hypothetical protein n=1 Tax=Streptosporangium sp. NBC_01756 TaxID=2975950 RepID=UPI002DD857FB|nr:hypothetical protein [Streptosporangium sp. NBC_01756]WSC88962.1 hypothetical protein OIE48_12465 [Streptosporangium sp. NBC_01756]